jgi:hypothetical protein
MAFRRAANIQNAHDPTRDSRIPSSGGHAELPDRGHLRHRQDIGLQGTTPPRASTPSMATPTWPIKGDPETGRPTHDVPSHSHHIWHLDRVRALVADQDERFTFFCGGSRNFSKFQDLFDRVFILEIDLDTLNRRLDQRPEDEFGAQQSERDLILRLHRTKEDTPKNGSLIDATEPLARVVEEIVRQAKWIDSNKADPA